MGAGAHLWRGDGVPVPGLCCVQVGTLELAERFLLQQLPPALRGGTGVGVARRQRGGVGRVQMCGGARVSAGWWMEWSAGGGRGGGMVAHLSSPVRRGAAESAALALAAAVRHPRAGGRGVRAAVRHGARPRAAALVAALVVQVVLIVLAACNLRQTAQPQRGVEPQGKQTRHPRLQRRRPAEAPPRAGDRSRSRYLVGMSMSLGRTSGCRAVILARSASLERPAPKSRVLATTAADGSTGRRPAQAAAACVAGHHGGELLAPAQGRAARRWVGGRVASLLSPVGSSMAWPVMVWLRM